MVKLWNFENSSTPTSPFMKDIYEFNESTNLVGLSGNFPSEFIIGTIQVSLNVILWRLEQHLFKNFESTILSEFSALVGLKDCENYRSSLYRISRMGWGLGSNGGGYFLTLENAKISRFFKLENVQKMFKNQWKNYNFLKIFKEILRFVESFIEIFAKM